MYPSMGSPGHISLKGYGICTRNGSMVHVRLNDDGVLCGRNNLCPILVFVGEGPANKTFVLFLRVL